MKPLLSSFAEHIQVDFGDGVNGSVNDPQMGHFTLEMHTMAMTAPLGS